MVAFGFKIVKGLYSSLGEETHEGTWATGMVSYDKWKNHFPVDLKKVYDHLCLFVEFSGSGAVVRGSEQFFMGIAVGRCR